MFAWLSGRLEQRRGRNVGPRISKTLTASPRRFRKNSRREESRQLSANPRDGLGALCSRVISGRAVMLKFTLRSGSVTPV
jgi:hypothetical protein